MTYLEELQSTLDVSKTMLKCLQTRIELLSLNDYGVGEEYAKNEDKITMIKTQGEINTLRSIIAEKEKYFEKYAKQFEIEKAEMDLNFDKMFKMIKIKRLKDAKLHNYMKQVDMDKVNSSSETKLAFYKTMKSFLIDKK
jgi:hypothetical protein